MILSDNESLAEWSPSNVFVKRKHSEALFSKHEETELDPRDFVEVSLAERTERVELVSDSSLEEAEEVIEPLQPLEPIEDEQAKESPQDIEAIKQQAFAEGEAKGRADAHRLAQEEFSERQQQFEIEARDEIARFMSSIKASLIQHNALAEPLKRLAVRLAELIARAELQLSDQAINNLVERVVNELEPNELEDVIITVSPGWHERMNEDQFKGLFENCDIQISEQLADGSIRLSVEDKSIEDLLEGRITEIASQVFDLKFPESISPSPSQDGRQQALITDQFPDDSSQNIQGEVPEQIANDRERSDTEIPIGAAGAEDVPEDDLAGSDIGEIKEATSFVLEPPAPDEASFPEGPVEEDG